MTKPINIFGAAMLVLFAVAQAGHAAERWQGGWGHPPTLPNETPPADSSRRPVYAPLPPYRDVTVRQIVRISASARAIKLRFSNEFGQKALRLGAVRIAIANADGTISAESEHPVTFAGKPGANIPPGAPLLSDAIPWTIPAFTTLAISVYYPEETVPPAHTLFALNAWQAGEPGNWTAAAALPSPVAARSGVHVSQVDILPVTPGGTLVAFGDSITEGVASSVGAYRAFPDRLAARLQALPSTRGWSIVNAGVGSNRLLHDTPSANALARFDRDVLSVPGIKAVLVLMGINDIQYTHRYPDQAVSAPEEIAALQQLIDRAHAAGIRIYGATILPFEGSSDYTPEGERNRQAVNDFIRSGAFDGVVDFDVVMRDPDQPTRLRADFEGTGHLHPNDKGYAAMGDAIALDLFAHRPDESR